MIPKRVLSIAGAASSGSAGIQADLKVFQEIGVYGMTAITAIVGRHPKTQKNVRTINLEAIEAQFHSAILHSGVDSLKTGMLFSTEIIKTVAELLKNSDIQHKVVDPVMVGKLDSVLLEESAIHALKNDILPQASVITPNMVEASILLDNRKIKSVEDMRQAAIDLNKAHNIPALVKGGRLKGDIAVDILCDGKQITYFETPKIDTINTNGAGCSYSAAMASYLALGHDLVESIRLAKGFITQAIVYSYALSDGPGPTNQLANRTKPMKYEVKVKTETL